MKRARMGVRDQWIAQVYAAPDIGDACRVLLLAMSTQMTDAGYVSTPRERLARMLDKSPARVSERIAEAKAARLLDQIGSAYKGTTARYVAVLRKVPAAAVPISTAKVPSGQVANDQGKLPPEQVAMGTELTGEQVPINRYLSEPGSEPKVLPTAVPITGACAGASLNARQRPDLATPDSVQSTATDPGTDTQQPQERNEEVVAERRHPLAGAVIWVAPIGSSA